jgi:prepilin-type N-terminal cleavage/methylation domain-containing protein
MIRTKLSNHLRDVRKNEGGFTLIELLIVIVVLGILAGIVVFGVGTFRADSEAAAKKADCKSVEVAAEAYNAKWGAYPTVITDLTTGTATRPGGYLKAAPASGVGATIDATGKPSGGC